MHKRNQTLEAWWRALAVAVFYALGAEVGHWFSFRDVPFATFWPPTGILLAALLLSPRRQWPLLVLWCAAANHFDNVVLQRQPSLLSAGFVLANALEATLAGVLIHLWTSGRLRVHKLQHMLLLILAGGLFCPMLGALVGAGTLVASGYSDSFVQSWRLWWAADGLGVLIVTPAVLKWATRRPLEWEMRWSSLAEAALVTLLLVLLTHSVFRGDYLLFYVEQQAQMRFPLVILPVLTWIALRFDLRGVLLANAFVALCALHYTASGRGPFAQVSDMATQLLLVQSFVGVTTLTTLSLGAGLAERRRSQVRLARLAARLTAERSIARDQSALLQAILDSIGDGVLVADDRDRILLCNPAAERLLGRESAAAHPLSASDALPLLRREDCISPGPDEMPLARALRGEATMPGDEYFLLPAGDQPERVVTVTARPLIHKNGQNAGAVVIMHDVTARSRADAERKRLIAELQQALSEIKTLKGLIPICASCKSIRDEAGYWQRLEAFLSEHTDAEFSHGICNDCGERLYGPMWMESQHAAKRAS